MKITSIIPQKNKKIYNIYIDGKFLCSVDEELIYTHKLVLGKEIEDKQLLSISMESSYKKAFNFSLRYLSYKMRTECEVREYLSNKQFSNDTIDYTIEKLKNYSYIDDHDYINAYIKDKMNAGYSRKRIQYKLIDKGFDNDRVLDMIHKNYPFEKELELISKDIIKMNKKNMNLPYRDKVRKINESCLRKGYNYEHVNLLIRELIEEKNFSDEFNERFKKIADTYLTKYKKKGYVSREAKHRTMQALYRKGYDVDIINVFFNDYE
ncbi:MAG: hypothetical protein ACOWWH_03070 [Eubacteriaceae bacterium]